MPTHDILARYIPNLEVEMPQFISRINSAARDAVPAGYDDFPENSPVRESQETIEARAGQIREKRIGAAVRHFLRVTETIAAVLRAHGYEEAAERLVRQPDEDLWSVEALQQATKDRLAILSKV